MNTLLLLQISFRSLQKHKGRSFLTMLGIIIGIAAIIATLAIGKGAEIKTQEQILAIGNNYIELFSGNWLLEGKTTAKQRRKAPYLRYNDVDILRKLCPNIKKITPATTTKEVISYEGNSLSVTIKGGNENFLYILNRKIKHGIFFNQNHEKRGARVVILGARSAKELFKTLNPIGKTVKINNLPFTVIGTLKSIKNYWGIHDPNFDILMPIHSLKKHLLKTSNSIINSIIISAPNKESISAITRSLRKIMRFRRKLQPGETDTFTIIDQDVFRKAAQSGAETISLLLLIIASISLIVGGIGIMNIMLVSVTERIKEIGIRMALGASSNIILKQFLFEALILCFIGGIIGIILGICIPYIVAHFTGWTPIVTPSSIIIAFLTTSLIGIFFGFYPAKKASNLNPVEALRDQ